LEDKYLLREVCATGPVEKRNGRYVVTVREGSQLQVERQPTFPLADLPSGSGRLCNGDVVKPTLVRLVRPTYTRAAFQAKVEGKVFLDAIVLGDGSVGAVRVLYSDFDPTLGLEQQAITAVKGSRFGAGTVDGRPAPVLVTLELMFTLR
jgi:TonB family protein